jgi:hypothetical protein
MNPYADLRNLMTNKLLNEGTKRAVRERLKIILDDELKQFTRWQDIIKAKLNVTRAAQVERRFNKEIQALKIVIHKLTPFGDRVDDEPSIIVKKPKKNP